MGFRFPEKPLLFYPSLARQIGSDEALLLGIYHDYLQQHGLPDQQGRSAAVIARQEWLALADFWDEERLAMTTSSLVEQGMILAAFSHGGAIRLTEPNAEQPSPPVQTQSEPPPVVVQELPVVEQPPERNEISRRVHQAQPATPRGPAPTFGGSIGWSRSRQSTAQGEFASRLNEIEEKNQKLHTMFLGWRPSQVLFDMLPRHSIPADFAEQLLDEFVLYWLDKDRKESNWDQKFLAWVKREWVNKQTRDARKQRAEEGYKGVNHENSRTNAQEKRERITRSIMDIKNTDW